MNNFTKNIGDPQKLANKLYFRSTEPNNPGLYSNYIPINDSNVCCLLKGLDCDLVIDSVKVPQVGKVGIPFIVTLKDHSKVVIKIITIRPFANFNDSPKESIKDISNCVGHTQKISFFGTDVFTNEVIVSHLLTYILRANGMPSLSVNHIQASICQGPNYGGIKGVTVMEYADLGSINKLPETEAFDSNFENTRIISGDGQMEIRVFNKETILNIVKQIIVIYDFLSDYDFNHSDAKVANALVFSSPIKFEYKDLTVDSPFTVKIADFDKAAITLNSPTDQARNYDFIRFFNKSTLADVYFNLFPFNPVVGTTHNQKYYKTDTTFNQQLFAQSRHTGLPFYHSYDIYTFMVSFLMMPEVFYKVFNDAELQIKIWQPLWFPEDISGMYLNIRDSVLAGKDPSFNNAVSLLSKTKLKCKVSNLLIGSLKLDSTIKNKN